MESSICSNGWGAMETTTPTGAINHCGNKQSSLSFTHDKWGAMRFSYVNQVKFRKVLCFFRYRSRVGISYPDITSDHSLAFCTRVAFIDR